MKDFIIYTVLIILVCFFMSLFDRLFQSIRDKILKKKELKKQ